MIKRELTQRERQGAAAPDESCQQRNMRMGWGCRCHGETFCPDLVCAGYEDDVPVFVRSDSPEGQAVLAQPRRVLRLVPE